MAIPDSGQEALERLLDDARTSAERVTVHGRDLAPDEVVRRLAPFLSDERRARIESILDERTYAVATVVEGLVNSGNVSAVMRTAEALGFQRFDLVAGSAPYKHSKRTTQGAEKWLDTHVWTDAAAAVRALKEAGYRVVATHLDDAAVPIDDIDFSRPIALVFGNELNGVSREMLELADDRCILPIVGMVQSFNISVAAALALYHARRDRIDRLGRSGDLEEDDRRRLRAEFYLRALRNARAILEQSLRDDSDG